MLCNKMFTTKSLTVGLRLINNSNLVLQSRYLTLTKMRATLNNDKISGGNTLDANKIKTKLTASEWNHLNSKSSDLMSSEAVSELRQLEKSEKSPGLYELHDTELYKSMKQMDVTQILALINTTVKQTDRMALALCMKNVHRHYLHRCQSAAEREEFVQQMRQDHQFLLLVAYLTKNSQDYDCLVIYDFIRFLHTFGYTSTDFPLKITLQLCRYHIENLYLDQLAKLAYIVNKMPPTKETTLLLEGIGQLIVHHTEKFDTLTTYEMVYILDIYHEILSEKMKSILMKLLWNDRQDMKIRQILDLISIFSHYPELDRLKKKLYYYCVQRVYKVLHRLESNQVIDLLENLERFKLVRDNYNIFRILYKDIILKSAEVICTQLEDDKLPFESKLVVLEKLWNTSLLNEKLLDDIIANMWNNKKVLWNNTEEVEKNSRGLYSLACYLRDLPDDLDKLGAFDLEAFTRLSSHQQAGTHDWDRVINDLWWRKNGSVPKWVTSSITEGTLSVQDRFSADGIHINRTNFKSMQQRLEFVAKTLNCEIISDECDCTMPEAYIGPTLETSSEKNEVVFTVTAQGPTLECHSEKKLVVFTVTSLGYFNNTGHMKKTTQNMLEGVKHKNNCSVFVINLDKYLEQAEEERELWLKDNLLTFTKQ